MGELQRAVETQCQVNLDACMECGCCSGGCSAVEFMDYSPRQVIKLIKLDAAEKLLHSSVIWLCMSCHICEDRCPAKIAIPQIMDKLREMALTTKEISSDQLAFHQLFIAQVARFGKIHEGLLALLYNRKSGKPLPELKVVLELMQKGRVEFIPPWFADKEFRQLAARALHQRGDQHAE